MTNEDLDQRVRLLNRGHRLSPPYQTLAVYDRDGHLGFRVPAHAEGPTECGGDVYSEYVRKLHRNETPIECYHAAVREGVPRLPAKVENVAPQPECGSRHASWARGSWQGLMTDIAAVVLNAARRYGKPLDSGYFMICVYSQNECWDARLTADPTEIHASGDVYQLAGAAWGWLMEDLARLAPGLLSRNLPTGCGTDYMRLNEHTHAPIRHSIMVDFSSPVPAHGSMECIVRYEEIVRATEGAYGRA